MCIRDRVTTHDAELMGELEFMDKCKKKEGRKWNDPVEEALDNIVVEFDDRV